MENTKTQHGPRVAVATLGCKANQYESGRMAMEFAARGCEVVDDTDTADILVINTCTVTNIADHKSRRQIRRLKRNNPNALVVATGCAAQVAPESLGAETGVDMVVPNREKAALVASVLTSSRRRFPASGPPLPLLSVPEDAVPENVANVRLPSMGRTRALLMVQDGCGYRCSYCIIPTARPVRNSRAFDELIDEAEDLTARGYREIVLTGISIGSWRDGHRRLQHIVRRMAEIPGLARIRMSSIEPKTVSDPLIEAFADLPQGCRHFHIPLQAGEDATLQAMNRYYDTAYFARLIARIRDRMPEAAISTDVITGFPTETDEQFETTLRFCRDMDFCKIHVFPFSPRAGTPASDLDDSVGPERRKERTARLIALSDEGARAWAERHTGRTVEVLAEPVDARTGLASGLTDNYVRVHWPANPGERGGLVNVRIDEAREGACYGVSIR
jgi:threonylcarbamoyladenosine tRNA methylthiotransferase MtaB